MVKDGGPAFPGYRDGDGFRSTPVGGMSLRDYFAAQAMQKLAEDFNEVKTARLAYAYADAMLKERDK